MAEQSRSALQTTINNNCPDNTSGLIDASDVRQALTNLNDSTLNKATDTNFLGLYPYSATQIYYLGQLVQYDYKWYSANATTVAGAFDPAYWDFQGYVKYSGLLTIPTASVLTLNTTPLNLVAAIASKSVQVVNASASMEYNSATYAANTTLRIYMTVSGAENVQYTFPSFLANTGTVHKIATVTANAGLTPNSAVKIKVETGDPTTGDSDVIIYYDYIVI